LTVSHSAFKPKPVPRKRKHCNEETVDEDAWVPCSFELPEIELRLEYVLPELSASDDEYIA
jgi:hypothetical protein